MWLSDTSVKRPVFATMVISAMIVFGLIAYNDLGVNEMPEVDFPYVTIQSILPGADPETVETEVTDMIEEAVNTIEGIKNLTSQSLESISLVIIEFELEKDVDVAVQDVRDKIATIRTGLPDKLEEPIVSKLDFNALPVMILGVTGRDVPLNQRDEEIRRITEYTKNTIQNRLQTITGVGAVQLIGGQEREIRVWLDAIKMRGYGLPVDLIAGAIASENISIPGGRIETDASEQVVSTEGELETIEDFNNLVITYQNGQPVRLRDIGYAQDGMEDLRSLSFVNDKRALGIEIRSISGANVVATADRVKEELAEINRILPDSINLEIIIDNSTFAKEALADVIDTMVIGGTLAILTILFFLRSFRTALISATVLPTAVIATFTFMNALGFTLNQLTMLALTISIGLLIDDAVVVIENIHRKLEDDQVSAREAAMKATSEIAMAVITATSTILGVFVPVAFMTGLIGRFFYEFGITVAVAVLMSLFISLTLTPMLSSLLLSSHKGKKRGIVYNAITSFLRGLDGAYKGTLAFTLKHRFLTLVITIAIFYGSMMLMGMIPGEFLPAQDEGRFSVSVETPLGSSIYETERRVAEVRELLGTLPGINLMYTSIGGGQEGLVNQAQIVVDMVHLSEREFSQTDLKVRAREVLSGEFPDLTVAVTDYDASGGAGGMNAELIYSLRSPNMDDLVKYSELVAQRLRQTPGFVDITTSYDAGKPEVEVSIDRNKAADLGVSVASIAQTINMLVGGEDVSTFQSSGEQFDVRLRLMEDDRDEASDIGKLLVLNRWGQTVEMSNLINVSPEMGPVEINRRDRIREVQVLANLAPDNPLGTAIQTVDQIAEELEIPPDIMLEHIGMAEIMAESFESMAFTLLLAVIIIYMVLASLFESFVHPFTIMVSLPLSISGGVGFLLLWGQTINIMSMIGFIMLMGLVTKNAILLIDRTIKNREEGQTRYDALLNAGARRLRPILMTAISTISGALPVALGFGAGAGFRSSMGVAIVGGMLSSTLLTLLAVPMIYSYLDDLANFRLPGWLMFWRKRSKKAEA